LRAVGDDGPYKPLSYIAVGGDVLDAPHVCTPAEEAVGYANASREQAIVLALRIVESLGK